MLDLRVRRPDENENPPTQQPKQCARTQCGELLPASFFMLDYRRKGGRGRTCLACESEYRARLAQREVQIPDKKTCGKCRVEQPAANFGTRKLSPDGLKSMCKDCNAAYNKGRAQLLQLPVQEKRCSSCGKVKAAAEFYKMTSRSDGLMVVCRECNRAAVKEHQQRRRKVR